MWIRSWLTLSHTISCYLVLLPTCYLERPGPRCPIPKLQARAKSSVYWFHAAKQVKTTIATQHHKEKTWLNCSIVPQIVQDWAWNQRLLWNNNLSFPNSLTGVPFTSMCKIQQLIPSTHKSTKYTISPNRLAGKHPIGRWFSHVMLILTEGFPANLVYGNL